MKLFDRHHHQLAVEADLMQLSGRKIGIEFLPHLSKEPRGILHIRIGDPDDVIECLIAGDILLRLVTEFLQRLLNGILEVVPRIFVELAGNA